MRVREIMTRNPSSAELESTTEEIASIMREEDVSAIAVLDEDQELAGVITDRDIVVLCIAEGHDASECKAEDILSKKIWLKSGAGVQAASPDMDAVEAAEMMVRYQVRRMPVIEEGRLVGMISLGDVVRPTGNQELKRRPEPMPGKGITEKQSNKAGRVSQMRPRQKDEQAEGLRSDSNPKKQGISNRNAGQESTRQSNVVPMREEARNRNVARPTSRKKAS